MTKYNLLKNPKKKKYYFYKYN